MCTYEFRIVIDNFDNITFLGRSNNASAEFFTEYLHFFSTPFERIDSVRYAITILHGSVLKELLKRTEKSIILIMWGDQFVTMILRP